MNPSPIVVVGSVHRDLQLSVRNLPVPGETVMAETLTVATGGKGANQATAVSTAAGGAYLVSAVGNDEPGRQALAALQAFGVDTTYVRVSSELPTGTAIVSVDTAGQNSIVVASGANQALDPEYLRASLRSIGDIRVMLVQWEVPAEVVQTAADYASSNDARFILNLAPYHHIDVTLLKQCDPVIVNEVEAKALSRQLAVHAEDFGALARTLAQFCESVVITVGADGAWVAQGSAVDQIPAPITTVVDTTGAGDAFVGALAASLSLGCDLIDSCRAGVEAGSRAVGYRGSQPTRTIGESLS